MQSWLAGKLIARNMARLRAGDYRPHLRLVAEDVRFRFPGDSSWATELRGKQELERWLARFVRVGLQAYPEEVLATGPPWRTTLCVRGTIHVQTPAGETVYENRYVIWGRLSWGRLREYEVYEDAQKSKALDEYLARIGELEPTPGPRAVTAAWTRATTHGRDKRQERGDSNGTADWRHGAGLPG